MRRWPLAAIALLAAAALVAVIVTVAAGSSSPRHGAAGAGRAPGAAADPGPAREAAGPVVTIGRGTVGAPIRPGFLGFSIEFTAIRAYTGNNPRAINPVLLALLRNLTPGQRPVIRIGGDSTDASWIPAHGVKPPPYVAYRLTPSWLGTTAALAHDLDARMMMGVNLAADEPAIAGAEARRFLRVIGRHDLAALEIGNEPNVYGHITVFHTLLGAPVYARPRDYAYPQFQREYRAEAAAMRGLPLAAPALAAGPDPTKGSWIGSIPAFLRGQPRVRYMTVHRYPLRNCFSPPNSPQYPTVANLLSSYSTAGLAGSVHRWLRIAHGARRQLRIDELNSVACRGRNGVSDVFAAALWAPDALFSLARAGVDGVNVHTLPGSAYKIFNFSHQGGHWHATVEPVYYGLELFALAAPARASLLAVSGEGRDPALNVWATRTADGTVRVLLINKSNRIGRTARLRLPAGLRGAATVERLLAPSVSARRGITLGGRSYGRQTYSGTLAPLRSAPLRRHGRALVVSVPHSSAALVTIGR